MYAQQVKSTLIGTVVDKASQQPVEFVTVILLNKKDSATIKTTITDKKGKFSIEEIIPGDYLIRYSFIGYDDFIAPELRITAAQKNINLGIVELSHDAKKLNEVTVSSTKTTLNTSIDRKVYNVDQDILSKSGAAS